MGRSIVWQVRMQVTIKDVAKRARVAIGTVSRVINDRPDVDAELRRRVLKAIEELNYRPNARARSFVQNTTPVISFIHSNRKLLHPFHSDVLQSVEEYCAEQGYYVMFTRYNYSGDTRRVDLKLPNVLRSHGIADCVILAGINYENFAARLDELRVPYVLFKNTFVSESPREPVDQVGWDDFTSSFEATKYLIRLGHRYIWYFADCSLPWFKVRYDGYARAMRDSGFEPRGQTVALSENYYANGYACMEVVLENADPVTAVFAGYDEIVYGAWDALHKRGLSVPSDVSLIGFHDEDQAQFKVPPLTTVRVDKAALGRQLARMAIDKLKFPGKGLPEIIVPTTLIKRGTTRPLTRDTPVTKAAIRVTQ